MNVLEYIVGRLKRGLITFIGMVSLAHRDWPYHDYEKAATTSAWQSYEVGDNNKSRSGDQHKFFVSKSTLIFCTTNARVIFNHDNNVVQVILANTWYEFMTNIYFIQYQYISEAGDIYIYTEGVAPNEARRPE